MGKLKNEYKSFLDDIEKNIKNKDDLTYIKKRFSDFVDVILEEVENSAEYKNERIEKIEKAQEMDYISSYKTEQIEAWEKSQKEVQEKLAKMQTVLDNIEKDIYSEDGFDFEIICPYCNYEFFVDIDENKTEIECPECKNTIELDWSGDIEDEPKENKTKNSNFQGGCPGCHGCGSFNIKKDEDDDM